MISVMLPVQKCRQPGARRPIRDLPAFLHGGVRHLGVIEDFFSGRTEELAPRDREKIEALLLAEAKKG